MGVLYFFNHLTSPGHFLARGPASQGPLTSDGQRGDLTFYVIASFAAMMVDSLLTIPGYPWPNFLRYQKW